MLNEWLLSGLFGAAVMVRSSLVGKKRQSSALQISDHEAGAGFDQRFHGVVRKSLGMMQDRVVRQRLDRGHANKGGKFEVVDAKLIAMVLKVVPEPVSYTHLT